MIQLTHRIKPTPLVALGRCLAPKCGAGAASTPAPAPLDTSETWLLSGSTSAITTAFCSGVHCRRRLTTTWPSLQGLLLDGPEGLGFSQCASPGRGPTGRFRPDPYELIRIEPRRSISPRTQIVRFREAGTIPIGGDPLVCDRHPGQDNVVTHGHIGRMYLVGIWRSGSIIQ